MVKDVLRAFATFHCAGYVHGDGHPGNVMILQAGKVKLIDFDRVASIGNNNDLWGEEVRYMKTWFDKLLRFHGRYTEGPLEKSFDGTCSLDQKTSCFLEKLKREGAHKDDYLFQLDADNRPKYCDQFKKKLAVEELFCFEDEKQFDEAEDCEGENRDLEKDPLEDWEIEDAERWENKWWVVKGTQL